jgi:membrane protease YdiL (CAAX protease family)
VWALEVPLDRCAARRAAPPVAPLLVLILGLGTVWVLVRAGGLPGSVLGVTTTVAGHGALLALAFGAASGAEAPAVVMRRILVTLLLLTPAAAATAVAPAGAVLYLAHAVWLLGLAARGRLVALGLARPLPLGATALGGLLGLALGGHLLASAALTLGYRLRTDGIGLWLAAVAYDVGANVPSGELLFRGVLFDRLQRRTSFAAAASVATAAWVARYLLDPSLPASIETVAGAVVYLGLLGTASCWLFWWSGSLVPSLVAALVFFATYRALAMG